jgi:hypothetical protein
MPKTSILFVVGFGLNLVGIATGYGLDGRRQEILLCSSASRPALGPTQALIHCISGALFSGVKRPGREVDHSPPASVEVKNGEAILPDPVRHHIIFV